jgi:hypothetical protein
VKYHEAVIDVVKNTLVASAQNPDLKQLLTEVVPDARRTPARCENVQAQLGSHASAR